MDLKEINENILELRTLLENNNRVAFNSKQAANYLSISVDTLLRLARINDIGFLKNGTSYIFRKKHLDDWLDKQEMRTSKRNF